MRIKIKFTKNTTPVDLHTQQKLNSYVHKCLGKNNDYHDAASNYAISMLQGGKLNKESQTLEFPFGAYFIASSLDKEFLNKLLLGVFNNRKFINGMEFNGVDYLEEVFYDGENHFATLSPFIIKNNLGHKKYSFATLNDENFEKRVEEYLINKISKINPKLNLDGFKVTIPESNHRKVKVYMVKKVKNIANQCSINFYCSKEVASLLFNIGIGQSTGSGFGTIYKTESFHFYK